jgi:essential nuclear protein 1
MPAVREDLKKNKKLNFHYFEALRKAIYKTNAWFQAVVLFLCENNATSREIQIVETLLKQMSIIPLSSAVAMIKMTQMESNPAVIHFLKALIEKKYKLPKKVVDNLAEFFLRSRNGEEELTVAWQQAFLSFCTQYSSSFDEMLKVSLKSVAEKHKHHLITPEIVKYLA